MYGAPRRKAFSALSNFIFQNFNRRDLNNGNQNPKFCCYECLQFGHMSGQCSKPRNVTANEHAMMRQNMILRRTKICLKYVNKLTQNSIGFRGNIFLQIVKKPKVFGRKHCRLFELVQYGRERETL